MIFLKRLDRFTFICLVVLFSWLNSHGEHNSIRSAEHAFQLGEISGYERLVRIAESLYDLDDSQVTENEKPLKCGAGYALQIFNSMDQFSPSLRASLRKAFSRPSLQNTFDTPEGHFKIHYNTTGRDIVYQSSVDNSPGDGHPDFINRIGQYLEYAYTLMVDSLNYLPPPNDMGAGGDDRYDVYLKARTNIYGLTQPESPSIQYSGHHAYTSYMEMHPNYDNFPRSPDASAKVTAAHEFFHAIQLGYNARYVENRNIWFMEISSTWMEEIAWPEVNDYFDYLPEFFSTPWKSLTLFNGAHEYGSVVWALFLSQRFNVELMHTIWNEAVNYDALNAIESGLESVNSSLRHAFTEFTLWNYFTGLGERGDPPFPHYEDARFYPHVSLTHYHQEFPIDDYTPHAKRLPDGLGSNYVQFNLDTLSKKTLNFNGTEIYGWGLNMVGIRENQYEILSPTFSEQNTARLNFENYEELILIPAVTSRIGEQVSYSYSLYPYTSELLMSIKDVTVADDFNGRIEPGETGRIVCHLYNQGAPLTHLDVSLSCKVSGVHLVDSTLSFPKIAKGSFSNDDAPFTIEIADDVEPQIVDFNLALESIDGDSLQLPFSLPIGFAQTLVVNDRSQKDVISFYESVLDSMALFYETVETSDTTAEYFLNERSTLIWIAQDSLGKAEQEKLSEFLSRNGKLVLVGDQIVKKTKDQSFFSKILNVQIGEQVEDPIILGIYDDTISQGQYAGFSAHVQNTPKDVLQPVAQALPVFHYLNEKHVAAVKYAGDYDFVYFAFPLHYLQKNHSSFLRPDVILKRSLAWLENPVISIVPQPLHPEAFRLHPTYPNPFNESTTISFDVPKHIKSASVQVFNIQGQLVKTLFKGEFSPGQHRFHWHGRMENGRSVSSGTFLLRFNSSEFQHTRKLILLR